MSEIHDMIDFKGRQRKISCLACSIQSEEVENPGRIAESKYFVAEQDYEIPIPGFVIVASKRHIFSIDEFTAEEQKDYIEFICKSRKSIREKLNVEHVYFFQREDVDDSHFHLWIFPRYNWMEEKFGKKIQSIRPIMEYARENLKNNEDIESVDESIEQLKEYLK